MSPLPTKVCPFCMVDAQTDADHCNYCGSSYDNAAPVVVSRDDVAHTRRRTYDGTHHLDAGDGRGVSLYAY